MSWHDGTLPDTSLSEKDQIVETLEIPLSEDQLTEKAKMSFNLSEEDQMIPRDSYGCFLQKSNSKIDVLGLWFLCQPKLTFQDNETQANVEDVYMR